MVQTQLDAEISPYDGISGAAVTVGGHLIGVVKHHLASDGGALSATPLTHLIKLTQESPPELQRWESALNVKIDALPELPEPIPRPLPPAIVTLPTRRSTEQIVALVLPSLARLRAAPAGSLARDVTRQADINGMWPSLVLVPGGLVPAPVASEYRTARRQLDEVREALRLPPDRIVIAPGADDVNPLLYQDSVRDQAAESSPLVPGKWAHLFDMLGEFATPAAGRPTAEQPWAWWESAELRTTVAVLNSTVYDTDQVHSSRSRRLGRDQLDQLAQAAAARPAGDWLRIGVMHDSPAFGTEAALADADLLLEKLGHYLHLIVHGQPRSYRERLSHLGSTVVLAATDNPSGGYLLVDLVRRHIAFGRVYDPHRAGWTGDTDLGDRPHASWRRLG